MSEGRIILTFDKDFGRYVLTNLNIPEESYSYEYHLRALNISHNEYSLYLLL